MNVSVADNPKQLTLIGTIALIPQLLFVAMQLNWQHITGRDIEIMATSTTIEAMAAVGAVVICPILAISSGVSLIKSEQNPALGWALVVGAPLLTILAFAARPR